MRATRPDSAQHRADVARRRRAGRRRLVAMTVLPQVPALVFIALFTGGLGLAAVVPATALTLTFFDAFPGPYSITPRNRRQLYLGVYPFCAWWVACVVFAILALVTVPVTALAGGSMAVAVGAIGLLAVLTGLRSVLRGPKVVRVSLRFPDLPPEFDGYRIAQLSDLHCGPFAPERRVARWVRRARRLGADLVAVTGDLIASGTSHVDAVGRALGGLAAPDGVMACMGNHDYFGAGEPLVDSLERNGLRVLRNRAEVVTRGQAALLVAGVDDTWTGRAQLPRALADRPAGAFPILLAHDPDLFPEAASLGVRLTLSGHTHGGQLGVPFLARRFNLAKLMTPFTSGLYRLGESALYVNRGVGTSGPPIRVGVPAEITLLTLRRG